MALLTLTDYLMGRERVYAHELTPELHANAASTLERANALLRRARFTGCTINSGWRPRALNAAVPNASPRSRHISCQAIDLCDDADALDAWCMANLHALAELGLWLEHPSATPGWCHVQIVPPASGNRVFMP
ncbi:MAG: hypothetical protein IT531_14440 [Burkholderiales bacterium]|nr:hypothetical protein [Burkholderiales bacterium]